MEAKAGVVVEVVSPVSAAITTALQQGVRGARD